MRVHLKFMILCVTCAFNWVAEAFRTVQNICSKRLPSVYQTTSRIGRSISGMFNTAMMKSKSQLHMISVS